jgi:hypothetical protein
VYIVSERGCHWVYEGDYLKKLRCGRLVWLEVKTEAPRVIEPPMAKRWGMPPALAR